MVVIKVEVARGWKAIADMIGCSVSTAKRLHRGVRKGGVRLPLVKEGGLWTLVNVDYLEWRKKGQD